MNKNGVVSASLRRAPAQFIVPRKKNQLRLYDDLENDICNDFMMDGEGKTIRDKKTFNENVNGKKVVTILK